MAKKENERCNGSSLKQLRFTLKEVKEIYDAEFFGIIGNKIWDSLSDEEAKFVDVERFRREHRVQKSVASVKK